MLKGKGRILSDSLWSILAMCVLHGTLQLFIYPALNRSFGVERFGNILYILAILNIVAPSCGLAANNVRLLRSRTEHTANGDYLLVLLLQFVIVLVPSLFLLRSSLQGMADYLCFSAMCLFTLFRFYGDAEYRMKLDYRGSVLYYCAVVAGYALGLLLTDRSGQWMLCFTCGELLCFVFQLLRGRIYRSPYAPEHWKSVFTETAVLAGSYLLYNTVLYLDRIILRNLVDSEAVSTYYVASLLGKTTALLVVPLSGVLLGHLTKNERKLNRMQFLRSIGITAALASAAFLLMLAASPIFLRIFYPDLAESAVGISTLCNLAQVMSFSAFLLLTILLTVCEAKWQLFIEIAYGLLFAGVCWLFTAQDGLGGFVIGSLIVNAFYFAGVVAIGVIKIGAAPSEKAA